MLRAVPFAAPGSAHAEAHALAAELYELPLRQRTEAVVEALKRLYGRACTTARWRCDAGFVEITLIVKGAKTRGVDKRSIAVADELVLAAVNAPLVGWRARNRHDLEVRHRGTRVQADVAQAAAAWRQRRRRVEAFLWALFTLGAWREAVRVWTTAYDEPTLVWLGLSLVWVVGLVLWAAATVRRRTRW